LIFPLLKYSSKKFFRLRNLYTVDITGEGKANALLIKALNLLMPILVPKEIKLGGFSTKSFDIKNFELSDYGKIYLDEIPINVSKKDFEVDKLKDHFTLYHKGETFTIDKALP